MSFHDVYDTLHDNQLILSMKILQKAGKIRRDTKNDHMNKTRNIIPTLFKTTSLFLIFQCFSLIFQEILENIFQILVVNWRTVKKFSMTWKGSSIKMWLSCYTFQACLLQTVNDFVQQTMIKNYILY